MLRFLLIFGLLVISKFLLGQPPDVSQFMPEDEINRKVAGFARMLNVDPSTLETYDKIITYEREVFVGKIYNITFTDVRYTCPPDSNLNSISKSRISQILYADGRRDVFIALEDRTVKQKELVDSSKIIIKNQKDWMKVLVTEEPGDVKDLTEKGILKAAYEGAMGNASNDDLIRQAHIILKKKAAVLKAHYVLIETKFFKKTYGDLPKVEVTARAFGY